MFSFFIEHVLGHIPYWFWPFFIGIGITAYLILGIAGIVASLAPPFKGYISLVRIACIAVVFVSVFMFGAEGTINVYKQQQIKDQGIVAVGKQASSDITAQVGDNLSSRQGETKTKTVYITKYIHDNAGKINTDCKIINDTAWEAYNQAVKNGGDNK